jgi:hypothetical protein
MTNMTYVPGRVWLSAFPHATGHHVTAWQYTLAQADAGIDFRRYATFRRFARIARVNPRTLLSAPAAVATLARIVANATTCEEQHNPTRRFA